MLSIYNVLTFIWIGAILVSFGLASMADKRYKISLAVMWVAILLRCVVYIEMC